MRTLITPPRILTLSLVALALTGCENLEPFKQQALSAVGGLEGQLKTLNEQVAALEPRLAALPKELPGVGDVATKFASGKDLLSKASATVSGMPEKIEAAFKAGNKEQLMALVTGATGEVGGMLATATSDLAAVATKTTELEVAAKAQAANFAKKLSTGFDLKGNLDGVEKQLLMFIEDAGKAVDKTTWFNFDRLSFATGSATLDLEKSKEQLENVAEILKAFPAVKLKIGGYTDNTGKAADNKKLSGARAQAVVDAVIQMGIAKDRLDGEGYGPEHPACPANDTEECKAQNRRIALRVTAK